MDNEIPMAMRYMARLLVGAWWWGLFVPTGTLIIAFPIFFSQENY